MVSNVTRAWSHSSQLSLVDRWTAAGDKLVRLGGIISGPMSEPALQDMQREIEKRTAPPEWSELTAAAGREFETTVSRYVTLHRDICQRQKKLADARKSFEHQLLNLIDDALLVPPKAPNEMLSRLFFGGQQRHSGSYELPGKVTTPDFTTASDYRAANKLVLSELTWLEAMAERIAAVDNFESLALDSQNRRLIGALFERQAAFESAMHQRVSLETARAAALQEQIDRLENKPRSKQRKKRK